MENTLFASHALTSGEIAQLLTEYHLVHRNLFKSLLKSTTMPLTQYHILSILERSRNMRMGEISQLMAISRPNLTPLVDKLVNLGYVDRIPDNHDRRVIYINITDSGREALEDEHAVIEQNVDNFCTQLTPDEYQAFGVALGSLVELAKKTNI